MPLWNLHLHSNANERTIGFARIFILIIAFIRIATDDIQALSYLSVDLFFPHGMMKILPREVIGFLIDRGSLFILKSVLLVFLALGIVGIGRRALVLGVCALLFGLYLGLLKGFGGHIDHRELPLLYLIGLLAVLPSYAGIVGSRSQKDRLSAGGAQAVMVALCCVPIFEYFVIGLARLIVGAPEVFEPGVFRSWIVSRSVRPNPYGLTIGMDFLNHPWMSWAVSLILPLSTCLELLAVCLLWSKGLAKGALILALAGMHVGIVLMMNIPFFENIALLFLCVNFTPLLPAASASKMQSAERRVSIIGGTLWGNRGAQAMLETTIGMLREACPELQFFVYSYYPRQDRALCRAKYVEILDARPLSVVLKLALPMAVVRLCRAVGIQVPERLLPREARALRYSSHLLDIGGITFADGRSVFLVYNVLSILPALMAGVPVVKLAQALGPFQSHLNRRVASAILPRCEMLFARGEETNTHLGRLPLPREKFKASSDIAFCYRDSFALTRENQESVAALRSAIAKRRVEGQFTIGVVPSALLFGRQHFEAGSYFNVICEVIGHLRASGAVVVLLPGATRRESPKKRNNDLIVIDRLRKHFAADAEQGRVLACDFDVSFSSIRALMSETDAVVSSRFHGMVASLSLGIPCMTIGWSHKYLEVMKQFGVEELCFDANAPMSALFEGCAQLREKRSELHAQIVRSQSSISALSGEQFNYLAQSLRD